MSNTEDRKECVMHDWQELNDVIACRYCGKVKSLYQMPKGFVMRDLRQ